MSSAKIAISMDEQVLAKLDRLVKTHVFPSHSKAIQTAVQEKLERVEHGRLAWEAYASTVQFGEPAGRSGEHTPRAVNASPSRVGRFFFAFPHLIF